MAKTINFSIGKVILQIALALFLAVGGIWALCGGGDSASLAIKAVFDGKVENIMVIVFGVVELLAGVFLLIELFMASSLVTLRKVLLLIIAIVWIVAIVLIDFLGGNSVFHTKDFLRWTYTFAEHLIVLGGLIVINVF